MKKGQRPSKHVRRVRTKRGRRARWVNPNVQKRLRGRIRRAQYTPSQFRPFAKTAAPVMFDREAIHKKLEDYKDELEKRTITPSVKSAMLDSYKEKLKTERTEIIKKLSRTGKDMPAYWAER